MRFRISKRLSNLSEDEIIPKPRSVKLHLKPQQIHIFRSRNKDFSSGLAVKKSACNSGDTGSICGSGRSPRKGRGNLLQYSCLENPMDRGAWWAMAMGLQRVGHNLVTEQQQQLGIKVLFHLHFPPSLFHTVKGSSSQVGNESFKQVQANGHPEF